MNDPRTEPQTARPYLMRNRIAILTAAILLAGVFGPSTSGQAPSFDLPPTASPEASPAAMPASGLLFEKNLGQWDAEALYGVKAGGTQSFVAAGKLVSVLTQAGEAAPGEENSPPVQAVLTMRFQGSNLNALVTPGTPNPHTVSYYLGDDPAQWIHNAPTYHDVTVHDLYPGIDLVYYGTAQDELKYDFIVHPGADPGAIRLAFEGIDNLAVNDGGQLILDTPLGQVQQDAPLTYQAADYVSNSYAVASDGTVGFQVGAYDDQQDLVIDPIIFASYLGGSLNDWGKSVATDSSGNYYVLSYGESTNYPATSWQGPRGYEDVMVTKLASTGATAPYSVIIGGSQNDYAMDIAVDTLGNAHVTGYSFSTNFPKTVSGQSFLGGSSDAFYVKLSSTGALDNSGYLGGPGSDQGNSITVDPTGIVAIAGSTNAAISQIGCSSSYKGGWDGFVSIFGNGVSKQYMWGGTGNDYSRAIAWGASNLYLAGSTTSYGLTTYQAMQSNGAGDEDVYLFRFNSGWCGIGYATYYGGALSEQPTDIVVDTAGNAYVSGWTYSYNLPTTSGAQQTAHAGGGRDGFVLALNAVGNAKIYATYLGGSSSDEAHGIGLDATGNAIAAGTTVSSNFPVTSLVYRPTQVGAQSSFLSKLNALGALSYSTYLGSGVVWAHGVAVDSSGNAIVVGATGSGFPVTPGAFRTTFGGSYDAYVAKMNFTLSRVPNAPGNFIASCLSPTGVYLTWDTPYDGGTPLSGYKVYRSGDSGATWALMSTQTTRTFGESPIYLPVGYQYKVVAYNYIGDSNPTPVLTKVPCDFVLPVITGGPLSFAWSTVATALYGVSGQDTYSGLASVRYSQGTTSGASNLVASTLTPGQPISGQTNPFEPQWTPAPVQGLSYVNLHFYDRAGNVKTLAGAFVLRYDAVGPLLSSLSSLTHPDVSKFYSAPSFSVDVQVTDAHSGVNGIYHHFTAGTTCPSSLAGVGSFTAGSSATFTQTGLPSFGQHSYCMQGVDNVGNLGVVTRHAVNVDRDAPDITNKVPAPNSNVISNALFIVQFNDADGGLDPLPRLTKVDVNAMVLTIEGVNIKSTYGTTCPANKTNPACYLIWTDEKIEFKSPTPWSTTSANDVVLTLKDTVVGANTLTESWSFTAHV